MVAGSLIAERTLRSITAGERSICPNGVFAGAGQWLRVIRAAWLHRSAEAAASWWHLLSEDAVSEARAAARRTARWIKSATVVRAGERVSRR
jgi:hypothetical protein